MFVCQEFIAPPERYKDRLIAGRALLPCGALGALVRWQRCGDALKSLERWGEISVYEKNKFRICGNLSLHIRKFIFVRTKIYFRTYEKIFLHVRKFHAFEMRL